MGSPRGDGQPAWSPDGTRIAFLSDRAGDYDLWIMNADGSEPVRITASPGVEREPDWQPLPAKFTFSGFHAPVDQGIVNAANAGQTIPIEYRLLNADGSPVSDPSHFTGLESRADPACAVSGVEKIETYAGDSGLRYLGDGYWQFNWKTSKSFAGQCRVTTATFTNGTSESAHFLFR